MMLDIILRLAFYSLLLAGLLSFSSAPVPTGSTPGSALAGSGDTSPGETPDSNAAYQAQGEVVKAYYDLVVQHFDRERFRTARRYFRDCLTPGLWSMYAGSAGKVLGFPLGYDGAGIGPDSSAPDIDLSAGISAANSLFVDPDRVPRSADFHPVRSVAYVRARGTRCTELRNALRLPARLMISHGIRFVRYGDIVPDIPESARPAERALFERRRNRYVLDMAGTGWFMNAEVRCSTLACGPRDPLFVLVWGIPTNPVAAAGLTPARFRDFFGGVGWIPGGYVIYRQAGLWSYSSEVGVWLRYPLLAGPFRHGPNRTIHWGEGSMVLSRGYADLRHPGIRPPIIRELYTAHVIPSPNSGHTYSAVPSDPEDRYLESQLLDELEVRPAVLNRACGSAPSYTSPVDPVRDSDALDEIDPVFGETVLFDPPAPPVPSRGPDAVCTAAFIPGAVRLYQALALRSVRLPEMYAPKEPGSRQACVDGRTRSAGLSWSFCTAAEYLRPRSSNPQSLVYTQGPLIAAIVGEPQALRREVFGF